MGFFVSRLLGFAVSGLLCLSVSADTIQTEDWGLFWQRGAFPDEISATRTPGSDDYSVTHRIQAPHVYAFLDAYDTRVYFATNARAYPAQCVHTNLAARFSHWSDMLDRKATLRLMRCGDDDRIIWGSQRFDEIFQDEGLVMQSEFDFLKNPINKCYAAATGCGWMPSFRSLQSSEYETPWYIHYAPPSYTNEFYGTGKEAVSFASGWAHVNAKEGGEGSFADYIWDFTSSNRHPLPEDYTLDWLMDEFIYSPSYATNMTVTTFRLHYPMFAAASQTLALFDRTYFEPGTLFAITNEVRGDGSVRRNAAGAASADVTVRNGEILLPDDFYVSFSATNCEERLLTTNFPKRFASPRVTVREVTGTAQASGTPEGCAADTYVTGHDFEDTLLPGEHADGAHVIRVAGDGLSFSFWLEDATGTVVCASKSAIPDLPPDGDYPIVLSGYAEASYEFRESGHDIDTAHSAGDVSWRYPSNTYYMLSTAHTFFRSFASCTNYMVRDGAWRDIDFDYGNPVSEDWEKDPGYGYASDWFQDTSPLDYPGHLGTALTRSLVKCRNITGSKFDTDPGEYCGLTGSFAEEALEGIEGWRAEWECAYNHRIPVNVTFSEGRVTIEDEPIAVCRVWASVGGSRNIGVLKPAISVDTKIKGLIQADWDFPQLKRME